MKKNIIKTNMKVNFILEPFNVEDIELCLKDENPFYTIYESIVNRLNEANINITPLLWEKDKSLKFPESVNIIISLVDNAEVFSYFNLDNNQNILGLFCITTGDGLLAETPYSDEFRVLVEVNPDNFKKHIKDAQKDLIDIDKFDYVNLLELYLITSTHEIIHAFEFLESSGGLSPHEIDNLYDSEEFSNSLFECSTGFNTKTYQDHYLGDESDEEIIEIVEERVEYKGKKLFQSLNIEDTLLNETLDSVLQNKIKTNVRLTI